LKADPACGEVLDGVFETGHVVDAYRTNAAEIVVHAG
jgi:hypothetical protein